MPGLRLEMANTKRDQDKRRSWSVVKRPSLSVRRSEARIPRWGREVSVGKPQTPPPPRRLAPESDPSSTSLEAGCGVSLRWAEELRFKPMGVSLQNGRLVSGGTRIRSGDTMIFRSVPNPAVRRHRLHLSGFWRSPTPDYSRSRVSLMNRGNAISSGWDRCARSKRSFWRTHRSLCASEPKPPRSFMNNPG